MTYALPYFKNYSLRVCYLLFFILSTTTPSFLNAQGDFQQRIDKIETDITALRDELLSMQKREGDFLSEIEVIDKKVTLMIKKLNLYQDEENKISEQIAVTSVKINDLKDEISRLQEVYEQQVVSTYLFARRKTEWLTFDWRKPLESLRRLRYFLIISEHERELAANLKKRQSEYMAQNVVLETQKQNKHALVLEIGKQLTAVTSVRNDKRGLIRNLRDDRSSRELAIRKLERSRGSLIAEIQKRDKERKSGRTTSSSGSIIDRKWIPVKGAFSKNKGKMNWPVNGKIVTKFGKYKDPVLLTTLNNSGIDIRADFGKPIRSIYKGQVSFITFMSGYGNTVIIDHGSGYYSVYSHLNEIYIAQGDLVQAGQTIATVGDSGSLAGPKLHFEIYAKQKPVNPVSYLRQ